MREDRERPRDHRDRLVALSAGVLVCALPLTGCGDYSPDTGSSTAGTTGQTATTGQLNGNSQGTSGAGGAASSTGGSGAGMGPAPCTNVTACGGDAVGTWSATSSCLPVTGDADLTGFGLGCTSAPVTGSLQVTGTWIANADGSLEDNTTTSGNVEIALPAACLNVSGTTTTCDRVGGPLQALGFASVTCTTSASGGCTCPATIQQKGGMAFVVLGASTGGSYTTSSNAVAVSGRNAREYSYCVSGTTMTMTPQGTTKTGMLMGTIVLQKQ